MEIRAIVRLEETSELASFSTIFHSTIGCSDRTFVSIVDDTSNVSAYIEPRYRILALVSEPSTKGLSIILLSSVNGEFK